MRLTVLGCHSPYPGPNGATAGYLLQTQNTNLLLDCGSGVISQLVRHLPLYHLDAVCLSHYHHDHVADIGVLQYGIMLHQQLKERTKGTLPVYGPTGARERGIELAYKEATSERIIGQDSTVTIGDVQLSFHRTQHDVPCYAMKIEHAGKVIVYGADSGPETVWENFTQGADLFICEGTFLERYKPSGPTGHLSVSQAASIAEHLKCQQFMVTHLFPAYHREEIRQEMVNYQFGKGIIAEIGLQIEM